MREANVKVRLIDVVLVLMLSALLGLALQGCGTPEKAEAAVLTQVDATEGMVRTIEEGVFQGGVRRPVTYDELVQYVYALRYGAMCVAYDLELLEQKPERDALAPPVGWLLPVETGRDLGDVAPIESGR